MKITVVGLGKIGLPLAVQFASSGHEVIGADVNAGTVATINSGQEPFPGETHRQERLADAVRMGLLTATTDTAVAVADSDVVVVVVPLFVDGDGIPDFGWMDPATKDIARGLKPGTLVAYETTLLVGTTRTRWKPMLEEGSGLTEGTDFHLVFSPERVLTGRVFADLAKPEPLRVEHMHLRDSILGKDADIITLQQGMITVTVAEAAIESARTGQTITMGL